MLMAVMSSLLDTEGNISGANDTVDNIVFTFHSWSCVRVMASSYNS